MYTIVIPGQIYRALDGLGVYEEAGDVALKAFKEAAGRTYGRVPRHFVTGDTGTLKAVLKVMADLVGEVDRGVTLCYELGVERNPLDRCARQPLLPAV